ncbi:helix-turn-helix transcriptional regulator [Bordetella genomosp. 11]
MSNVVEQSPNTLIKIKRLTEITQLCRASIYSRYNVSSSSFDPDFPPRIYLSPRTVRWKLGDVLAWIERRPNSSAACAVALARSPLDQHEVAR